MSNLSLSTHMSQATNELNIIRESMTEPVYFTRAMSVGREREYLNEVLELAQWGGGHRKFTERCDAAIRQDLGVRYSFITHSCTAALEIAALVVDLKPGDEVIMPSFTFVSTANAVVLRGAVPVFVDIRPDTLNIDENLIEAAITPRTKMIIVVHYAGVCCEMDSIMRIAAQHRIPVVEDAAQAYLATYADRYAGALGDMASFSFHETKNITSGEGGAFVTQRPELAAHAEIVWEKGTDRSKFLRGEIDKYSWVEMGSSYLPSELVAAVLFAQLEQAKVVTQRRTNIWERYFEAFASVESDELARRPTVPTKCKHNGHLFYLILPSSTARDRLAAFLKRRGVAALSHYVPLHSSKAGRRYTRANGEMTCTDRIAACLLRLPLHVGLQDEDVNRTIDAVMDGIRAPS